MCEGRREEQRRSVRTEHKDVIRIHLSRLCWASAALALTGRILL